jgi:flagellar biosynthesis/type III secretory pathway chaperone
MTELIQNLIDCLREELKEYGEMLALLDQQQDMLVRRATQDLLENVAAIDAQGAAIQGARLEREQRRLRLSRYLALPDNAAFSLLNARLPAAYRPLVQALVQENNDLLRRVQQRARQNHLLLYRALELMQRLISSLAPATGTPVYNDAGALLAPAGTPPQSLYDAIG